jgi:hypothetical protein
MEGGVENDLQVRTSLGNDELYPLTPLSAFGDRRVFKSAEATSAK